MASPRPLTDEEMMAEEIRPITDEEMGEGDPSISKGTSAVRGAAQGVTMGLADEALGAIGVPVQKAMDAFTGNKLNENATLKELYQRLRDEERLKDKDAKEANPKTYIGGEFAGGAASAVIPGAQGQTAAKLAALGGIQGLGNSEADLTEGDVVGAGRDAGIGATLGVVAGKGLPLAAKGIGYAAKKLKDAAGWAGKKTISTVLGPSMEAVEARFANPNKIKNAKSYADLADDFAGSANKVSDDLSNLDSKAWATLKTTHDPLEGAVPKKDILPILQKALRDPQITGGGTFGRANKSAASNIGDLINDLQGIGAKVPGKLKSVMGAPSSFKNKDYLSEKQLKEMIQSLDSNINWDDPAAEPLNQALEGLRSNLDDILKTRNTDYAKAMEPVADRTDLLAKSKRLFGLKKETGEGFVAPDLTATKIQTATRENKAATQDTLARIKALTGRDYLDESETYGLAKEFEGGKTQGSRRVNLGGGIGAGAGFFMGSGPGSMVGAMGGAAAGAYLDKEGGKVAAKVIDSTIAGKEAINKGKQWLGDKIPELIKSNPQVMGKYAPAFQNAMTKGAQQVGLTHWLLMNNDPEYRQMLDGIEKQGEPQ